MTNCIFIHIPKTGGTTINTAISNTYWQDKPNEFYRHILDDKTSNSGDIFDHQTNEKYRGRDLFMMVRNPIDRMVSEYFFIKERKEFIDLLKPKPLNFQEYLECKQTQNYMVGFLKGRRMYDRQLVSEGDLNDVISSIEKLDIKVGIFEHYNDSLAYLSEKLELKLPKELNVKRVTLKRPTVNELDVETIELIMRTNSLDFKLYNYCVERFHKDAQGIKGNFRFKGDKFDHVIAYAARACFYEFCINRKQFILNNFDYFKDFTFYVLEKEKIRDGRLFATIWNSTFLKHIDFHFQNSGLNLALHDDAIRNEDPIEFAYNIGSAIDKYLEENPHERYAKMTLNRDLVKIPAERKSSFFQKIFGK